MALSKPSHLILSLTSAYFERLYVSPVKTKAVTSCVIAALSNLLSQKLSGSKSIDEDSVIAFGLFGLFFGGPVPHYFYQCMQHYVKNPLTVLLIERLIYTPCFQALALYVLARFEGKNHVAASNQLKKLYLPILKANLQGMTLFHYLNIRYVPPPLRVLTVNMIGFLWSMYIANKRAQIAKDKVTKK